jgi:hypothetical protein
LRVFPLVSGEYLASLIALLVTSGHATVVAGLECGVMARRGIAARTIIGDIEALMERGMNHGRG